MKQRTRYGIFYRHDTYHGWVILHVPEHLFKRAATYYLHLFTLEIVVCRNVVKTA
jgi:hypothetical protein